MADTRATAEKAREEASQLAKSYRALANAQRIGTRFLRAMYKRMSEDERERALPVFVVTPTVVNHYNHMHRLFRAVTRNNAEDLCSSTGGIACTDLAGLNERLSAGASQSKRLLKTLPNVLNPVETHTRDSVLTLVYGLLDSMEVSDPDLSRSIRDDYVRNINAIQRAFHDTLQDMRRQLSEIGGQLSETNRQLAACRARADGAGRERDYRSQIEAATRRAETLEAENRERVNDASNYLEELSKERLANVDLAARAQQADARAELYREQARICEQQMNNPELKRSIQERFDALHEQVKEQQEAAQAVFDEQLMSARRSREDVLKRCEERLKNCRQELAYWRSYRAAVTLGAGGSSVHSVFKGATGARSVSGPYSPVTPVPSPPPQDLDEFTFDDTLLPPPVAISDSNVIDLTGEAASGGGSFDLPIYSPEIGPFTLQPTREVIEFEQRLESARNRSLVEENESLKKQLRSERLLGRVLPESVAAAGGGWPRPPDAANGRLDECLQDLNQCRMQLLTQNVGDEASGDRVRELNDKLRTATTNFTSCGLELRRALTESENWRREAEELRRAADEARRQLDEARERMSTAADRHDRETEGLQTTVAELRAAVSQLEEANRVESEKNALMTLAHKTEVEQAVSSVTQRAREHVKQLEEGFRSLEEAKAKRLDDLGATVVTMEGAIKHMIGLQVQMNGMDGLNVAIGQDPFANMEVIRQGYLNLATNAAASKSKCLYIVDVRDKLHDQFIETITAGVVANFGPDAQLTREYTEAMKRGGAGDGEETNEIGSCAPVNRMAAYLYTKLINTNGLLHERNSTIERLAGELDRQGELIRTAEAERDDNGYRLEQARNELGLAKIDLEQTRQDLILSKKEAGGSVTGGVAGGSRASLGEIDLNEVSPDRLRKFAIDTLSRGDREHPSRKSLVAAFKQYCLQLSQYLPSTREEQATGLTFFAVIQRSLADRYLRLDADDYVEAERAQNKRMDKSFLDEFLDALGDPDALPDDPVERNRVAIRVFKEFFVPVYNKHLYVLSWRGSYNGFEINSKDIVNDDNRVIRK